MTEKIKLQILSRIDKALEEGKPLPLKDLVSIGQMVSGFEQTEVAKQTLEVSKIALERPQTVVGNTITPEPETTM